MTCVQVRARNSNLWLGADGKPCGKHADTTLVQAPVLRTHWVAGGLWIAFAAVVATQVVLYIRQVPCTFFRLHYFPCIAYQASP